MRAQAEGGMGFGEEGNGVSGAGDLTDILKEGHFFPEFKKAFLREEVRKRQKHNPQTQQKFLVKSLPPKHLHLDIVDINWVVVLGTPLLHSVSNS